MKKTIYSLVIMILLSLIAYKSYHNYQEMILNEMLDRYQESLTTREVLTFPDEIDPEFIIQGCFKTEDSILVSAYMKDWKSLPIVIVYDLDGNYQSYVYLNSNSHVGAIYYDNGKLYLPSIGLIQEDGTHTALIDVFDYHTVTNIKHNGRVIGYDQRYTYYDYNLEMFSSASSVGNSLVATLAIGNYQGERCFFLANFYKGSDSNTHLFIVPFSSIIDNKIDNSKVTVISLPFDKVQGICILDDHTLLFSSSWGNHTSYLYKCSLSDQGELKLIKSTAIPAYAEQISLFENNELMIAYEGNNRVEFVDLEALELK